MGNTLLLIPEIDTVVVALCADYFRRASVISEKSVTHKVEMEYKYLNYKIFVGAAEIVGEESALSVIRDIGDKVGYAKSADTELSEVTYKKRKQAVKHSIAKKLLLID